VISSNPVIPVATFGRGVNLRASGFGCGVGFMECPSGNADLPGSLEVSCGHSGNGVRCQKRRVRKRD